MSVKIIKNIFRKCEHSATDPYIGLLQYRNTPRYNLNSPAQLLMSRQLRTKLPSKVTNLKPKIVRFAHHTKNKQYNLQRSKYYYDQHAKVSPEFKPNDLVYFKKKHTDINWYKGRIKSKTKFPRSYIVQDDTGNIYRRNSQYIRKMSNYKKQHLLNEKSNESITSANSSQNDVNETTSSSNIYQHGYTISDSQSINENQTYQNENTTPYVTRYGRTINKPQRLGEM